MNVIITAIMNTKLIVSVAIVFGVVNVVLAQPRRVLQLIDGRPQLVDDGRGLENLPEVSTTRIDQRQLLNSNEHQQRDMNLSVTNENEQHQQQQQQQQLQVQQQQQQQQQQQHQHQRQQNDLNADNIVAPGAPIGPDGRVIDTPAVAIAKAEHAAAHINQKVNLAKESARNAAAVAANVATSGTILVAIAPTPGLTYDTIYY